MARMLVVFLSSLALGLNEPRAVTKVVNMLRDMQKQLEEEAEKDQEVFDKMKCWCTTNDKGTTQAIETARDDISKLTADIEELAANSARLNTEIKNVTEELASNKEALAKATALREKQLAEFNAEERDTLESLTALKAAITVLSKHHTSLLQSETQALINVAEVLRHVLNTNAKALDSFTTSEKETIQGFIQAPGYQSYSSQSGEIFGILKQMKDTFEENLSSSQKEEMANQTAFDEFKKAKDSEIAAGEEQLANKTEQLATTDQNHAEKKQALEDTRNSLSADEKFLLDLKMKCQMTDQEWEQRQKDRATEIEAVATAIGILDSDDAHANFAKSFPAAESFVQKESTEMVQRRAKVSQLLRAVGEKNKNPKMVAIAVGAKLNAFTRVKKAIDDMVAQLLKEKDDEIKVRDFCLDATNTNERGQVNTNRDIDEVNSTINTLTGDIEEMDASRNTLVEEREKLKEDLKEESENRDEQNKDFQTSVADQREAQRVLQQAAVALKKVYASFLQGEPAPGGFRKYEKNAGGATVLKLLSDLVNESKAMEKEITRDEEESQAAYESFVAETQNSLDEKEKSITNLKDSMAKKSLEKTENERQLEEKRFVLDGLLQEQNDLEAKCNFTVNNFDARQKARDDEVAALRQAKAILSGANFQTFLQRA